VIALYRKGRKSGVFDGVFQTVADADHQECVYGLVWGCGDVIGTSGGDLSKMNLRLVTGRDLP